MRIPLFTFQMPPPLKLTTLLPLLILIEPLTLKVLLDVPVHASCEFVTVMSLRL